MISNMVISTKYTHADLLAMPEDNVRREILDGELIVSPSPKLSHQSIVTQLMTAFIRYLDRHPVGRVYAAPLDVIFSEFDVLQPDLMFVRNQNRAILQDWVRGAPDLVVEILSPGSTGHDRGPKLKAYGRFGVPEYWIVDPGTRALEVYRQSPVGYELIGTFKEQESVTSPLLPDFVLPVAQIFEA